MKCRNCGADIPEGSMYCTACGQEVQIVPDYNPLDEMLTAHVRGSIGAKPERRTRDGRRELTPEQKERRQAMRLKKAKQKRMKLILAMVVVIAAIIGIATAAYRNTYAGLVSRGNDALLKQRYKVAADLFEKAIQKNGEKADAYEGLAKVYQKEKKLQEAEDMFLKVIESQASNSELYEALIQFYIDTKQSGKIPVLIDSCEAVSVLEDLSDYIVATPLFNLEDGIYEGDQKLELTSEEEQIFYTLDETEPTVESTPYGKEIDLREGSWTVKAIAVNKKGIPSLPVTRQYTIEAPVTDAPNVTPATGKYETPTKIEVEVPEGYKAYYTTGNEDPNASSTEYTGPIDMPEGNTIFSFVLINEAGKMSPITKKNYDLILADSE